jgi:hypothetical protein
MLCEQSETNFLGRVHCGPVYRQPPARGEADIAYTYVNAGKLFRFVPVD